LQVIGHHRVADINSGALCCNLELSGHTRGAVAGNHVIGVRDANLLVRGCGALPGVCRIEPTHRIAICVGYLLQQQQVRGWRQKPRIEHPGREDHLVGEFVLLLCDVVGLQRCRGDLHGVGEDLLALLELPDFVGDGSLFVLDLRDGVPSLCRIEDDAGTELCICERLQRRKPNGEHGKG